MHPLVTHCLGVIAVHKIKLYFRFETSLEVIHSPTKFGNTVLILAQGKVEKNSSSYFCIRYIKWYYKCCETDKSLSSLFLQISLQPPFLLIILFHIYIYYPNDASQLLTITNYGIPFELAPFIQEKRKNVLNTITISSYISTLLCLSQITGLMKSMGCTTM